jgi:hypothetical protein
MAGETRKNSSIGGNTRKCRGGVRAIKSSRSMVQHVQPDFDQFARPPASRVRIRAGSISPPIHHPSQQSTDMTRFSLSDAPQELIDEIIDRCSRNKRTLIACSLISRVWVYRTRKHLFSTLTLTDKTLPICTQTPSVSHVRHSQ